MDLIRSYSDPAAYWLPGHVVAKTITYVACDQLPKVTELAADLLLPRVAVAASFVFALARGVIEYQWPKDQGQLISNIKSGLTTLVVDAALVGSSALLSRRFEQLSSLKPWFPLALAGTSTAILFIYQCVKPSAQTKEDQDKNRINHSFGQFQSQSVSNLDQSHTHDHESRSGDGVYGTSIKPGARVSAVFNGSPQSVVRGPDESLKHEGVISVVAPTPLRAGLEVFKYLKATADERDASFTVESPVIIPESNEDDGSGVGDSGPSIKSPHGSASAVFPATPQVVVRESDFVPETIKKDPVTTALDQIYQSCFRPSQRHNQNNKNLDNKQIMKDLVKSLSGGIDSFYFLYNYFVDSSTQKRLFLPTMIYSLHSVQDSSYPNPMQEAILSALKASDLMEGNVLVVQRDEHPFFEALFRGVDIKIEVKVNADPSPISKQKKNPSFKRSNNRNESETRSFMFSPVKTASGRIQYMPLKSNGSSISQGDTRTKQNGKRFFK